PQNSLGSAYSHLIARVFLFLLSHTISSLLTSYLRYADVNCFEQIVLYLLYSLTQRQFRFQKSIYFRNPAQVSVLTFKMIHCFKQVDVLCTIIKLIILRPEFVHPVHQLRLTRQNILITQIRSVFLALPDGFDQVLCSTLNIVRESQEYRTYLRYENILASQPELMHRVTRQNILITQIRSVFLALPDGFDQVLCSTLNIVHSLLFFPLYFRL